MGLAALHILPAEGARVVVADVSEKALSRAVIDEVLAMWGTIDILINNGGLHSPKGVLEAELDEWNRVLAVDAT